MQILQEILKWAQELPPWQSDAVARLLAKQMLAQDDLNDLYALLKVEYGIPDPKGRISKPLAADQIPAQSKASTNVELLAIKDMYNVNAIVENQRLPFGSTGLTVIPEGIKWLVEVFKSDIDASNTLVSRSSERMVKRLFYNHISKIKNDKMLIDDYVWILNRMVDLGSSDA